MKKKFCGLFALLGFLGLATAEESHASIMSDNADVIVCTFLDGADAGLHVLYLVGQTDSNGHIFYRHPAGPGNVDIVFNSDGTFNSKSGFPNATNCDNKSLTQIASDEQARLFASEGQLAPAGEMTYFNLASCPTRWTKQIQLLKAYDSDQPMVLCRTD